MHFMREIKTEVKSLTNIILFYGLFNRLHKDAIFLEIGKKINLTVSLSNTFTGIWSQLLVLFSPLRMTFNFCDQLENLKLSTVNVKNKKKIKF